MGQCLNVQARLPRAGEPFDQAAERPFFSPDDRWITFDSKRRLRLAPFRRDEASPERDWKTLIELTGNERGAGWSPDGKLLYVLLERDGFRFVRRDGLDGNALTWVNSIIQEH